MNASAQESPSHQGIEKTDCSVEESERERERARRASETAEQREERLRARKARDRARGAAQTAQERDASCGKYAITDVRVWQLKAKRREQLGFSR